MVPRRMPDGELFRQREYAWTQAGREKGARGMRAPRPSILELGIAVLDGNDLIDGQILALAR